MSASSISSGPGVGVGEGVGVGDGVGVCEGEGVGVTEGVSAKLVASAAAVAVSWAPTVAVARIDSSNASADRVAVPVAACCSAAAVVSERCEPGVDVDSTWAAANFTCAIPPPKSIASIAAVSSAARQRQDAPTSAAAMPGTLSMASLLATDYSHQIRLYTISASVGMNGSGPV